MAFKLTHPALRYNGFVDPSGGSRDSFVAVVAHRADFEASRTLARARQAVELVVAKRNYEGHVSPEIAKDSEDMLKALKDVERGWQRAMDKIAERAGLSKSSGIRR